MKRGTLLLIPLVLILLAPALHADEFTLIPEQLTSLPGLILLNYNGPVSFTGGELYPFEPGDPLRSFEPGDFVAAGGNNYTITTGLVPEGMYKLVIDKTSGEPPYDPLETDVVVFSYVALTSTLDIALGGNLNILRSTLPADSPSGELIPETGFATSSSYSAEFTTTKSAWCQYHLYGSTDDSFFDTMQETGSPGALVSTHRITGLNQQEYPRVTVYCQTDNAAEQGMLFFTLGYERVRPTLSPSFDPPLLVDRANMRTNLTIDADQKIYCEATSEGASWSSTSHYPADLGIGDAGAYVTNPWIDLNLDVTPAERTEKYFNLTCTNRAGLSTTEELSIVLDPVSVASLSMDSPERYTWTNSPEFAVKTIREGLAVESSNCEATFDNGEITMVADEDGIIWRGSLGTLEDGDYYIDAACYIAPSTKVEDSFQITVDTQAPPQPGLWVPQHVCEEPLFAELNLSKYDEPDPNFNGYLYNITYDQGNKMLESGHATGSEEQRIEASVAIELGETYHWHIWAIDLALNKGTELTGSTLILDEGETLCDYTPPEAWLDINKSDTGTFVVVHCEDTDSGCADTFTYDKLGENASIDSCTYSSSETVNRSIAFYEEASFCYKVTDLNGNEDTGFRVITVENDIPDPEDHCTNGIADADLETDVDCGGQCEPCEIVNPDDPPECETGSDCATDYCGEGNTCESKGTCTDALLNGYETAIDCGGPDCDPCAINQECEANDDCLTGNCDSSNTCKEEPVPEFECENDGDCAYGKECIDTYCVTIPATPCESDDDCDFEEECSYGECVSTQEPDIGKKFSILALILIIIGVLTMGGSGYWLYALHEEREEDVMMHQEEPAYEQRPQELTSEQRLALQKQRQAQIEAMKQRQALGKERMAEKSKERAGLTDSFDDEKKDSKEKDAKGEDGKEDGEEEKDAKPAKKTKKLDEGSKADFLDVRDLGKKEKKYTPKAKISKDPIKRKDTFDELDEIASEDKKQVAAKKAKEDTFDELEEVIEEDKEVQDGEKKGAK